MAGNTKSWVQIKPHVSVRSRRCSLQLGVATHLSWDALGVTFATLSTPAIDPKQGCGEALACNTSDLLHSQGHTIGCCCVEKHSAVGSFSRPTHSVRRHCIGWALPYPTKILTLTLVICGHLRHHRCPCSLCSNTLLLPLTIVCSPFL